MLSLFQARHDHGTKRKRDDGTDPNSSRHNILLAKDSSCSPEAHVSKRVVRTIRQVNTRQRTFSTMLSQLLRASTTSIRHPMHAFLGAVSKELNPQCCETKESIFSHPRGSHKQRPPSGKPSILVRSRRILVAPTILMRISCRLFKSFLRAVISPLPYLVYAMICTLPQSL